MSTPEDAGLTGALHHLLLRLAGRVPDELVSRARSWLAAGQPVDVVRAVVFGVLQTRAALSSADAVVLGHVLVAAEGDAEILAEAERSDDIAMPLFRFAPVDPVTLAEQGDMVAYSIDLTSADEASSALDDQDAAALRAVSGADGAHALWRAWRYPAVETPWPPPRRVYLLQGLAEAHTLPELTERVQRALIGAGDPDPQVESFADAEDLPPYQRAALGYAALLWTAAEAVEVRLATLFDAVDSAGGPGFGPDHPVLEGAERDRVLAYLDAGAALLITTTVMDDVVDGDRPGEVPMNFRTDGQWVWTDAVAYYLTRYNLAPDAGLVEHILAGQDPPVQVDAVALHRAMAALQASAAQEDAWV